MLDFSTFSSKVKIVEVGPRDGLQNEKQSIDTETKITYILKLIESGLTSLEVTSFVSPKAIPQMADSEILFAKLKEKIETSKYELPCLVPNLKGLETAMKLGVREIALFTATSSAFTQKNINATVDESFSRMREIAHEAKRNGIRMRGYISTAFGCPYQGHMSVKELIKVTEKFLDFDLYELSIGDTIGMATPKQVQEYLPELIKVVDKNKLAMHFHDTRGMALANVLVSLSFGINIFDSSSGGLGGCPYAKGATGNLATEDLLYLLNSCGSQTNVDMMKLSMASKYILDQLQKETPSKFLKAYLQTGK
jgi:hydroxymethylglutaryl-CoA lyase